jgi:hypothetical protein
MNPDPNQAKAIFLEAVEKHAPEQWPAFLDQACAGHPEPRQCVEVLLQAHREVGTGPFQAGAEAPSPRDAGVVQACQQGRQAAEVLPALERFRREWLIRCCWHRVTGNHNCHNGSIWLFYRLKSLYSCFRAKREEK